MIGGVRCRIPSDTDQWIPRIRHEPCVQCGAVKPEGHIVMCPPSGVTFRPPTLCSRVCLLREIGAAA